MTRPRSHKPPRVAKRTILMMPPMNERTSWPQNTHWGYNGQPWWYGPGSAQPRAAGGVRDDVVMGETERTGERG